jgi:hypothetical protein
VSSEIVLGRKGAALRASNILRRLLGALRASPIEVGKRNFVCKKGRPWAVGVADSACIHRWPAAS